jgi:hypothetical protein
MVRPLTKRKGTGELYTRPARIEANIAGAVGQDAANIQRRLRVTERESPDYLTSECLVHLFRESIRHGDERMRDNVVTALLTRCKGTLDFKIRSSYRNAEELREEVLQEFAVLLANDGTGDNQDELDFFECRFNGAFAAFRIDVLRREQGQLKRFAPLPVEPESGDDDEPRRMAENGLSVPPREAERIMQNEFLNLLPSEVRKAVVLREMGYDVESEDPAKITVATLCGVTGRTIRNRLKQAAEYLSKYNQEDI